MSKRLAAVSVFHFTEYKPCVNALLSEVELQTRGLRAKLAKAIGCQPAYLSRVLNGDAEFSLEQAQALCKFFVLSPSETSFFISLVGAGRAGTVELNEYWRKQMAAARSQHMDLSKRLGLNDRLTGPDVVKYYGSWYFAAVHIAVSIAEFQTVAALSNYLSLSEVVVCEALDFLISCDLVRKDRHRYVATERDIHLGRNDPMIAQHHMNWKMKSVEYLMNPSARQVHYTGVVSLSREDVEKMNELIQQSVERARTLVRDSKEEVLGCYQFGFFEVGDQ